MVDFGDRSNRPEDTKEKFKLDPLGSEFYWSRIKSRKSVLITLRKNG